MIGRHLLSLVFLILGAAQWALALPPITVAGQYFINSQTKGAYYAVGINYITSNSTLSAADLDPMTNPDACLRDAALFQKLGINAVHVASIDPTADHDECFSIFDSVGIYVLVSLSWNSSDPTLAYEVIQKESVNSPSELYTTNYMQSTFAVIDAVMNYENTLGFVVVDDFGFGTSSYELSDLVGGAMLIKALTRDTKQYIAKNAPRIIPVGYSSYLDSTANITDFAAMSSDFLDYTNCYGVDATNQSSPDFYGITDYRWCPGNGSVDVWGDGSVVNGTMAEQFDASGYSDLEYQLSSAPVPVFFSAYGCIFNTASEDSSPTNRDFLDVQAIYNIEYLGFTFAGGFLWEYANVQSLLPGSNYGIVNLDREGNAMLRTDFVTLENVLSQFNLQQEYGVQGVLLNELNQPVDCASVTIGTDYVFPDAVVSTSFVMDIPTPPSDLQKLITSGAGGRTGSLVPISRTSGTYSIRSTDGSYMTNAVITPAANYMSLHPMNGPSNDTSSDGGSSGLSSGAKGGIVAAVVLLVLLLAGFLTYRFWYKPRETARGHAISQEDKPHEGVTQQFQYQGPIKPEDAQPQHTGPSELNAVSVSYPSELPSNPGYANGTVNDTPWELEVPMSANGAGPATGYESYRHHGSSPPDSSVSPNISSPSSNFGH